MIVCQQNCVFYLNILFVVAHRHLSYIFITHLCVKQSILIVHNLISIGFKTLLLPLDCCQFLSQFKSNNVVLDLHTVQPKRSSTERSSTC